MIETGVHLFSVSNSISVLQVFSVMHCNMFYFWLQVSVFLHDPLINQFNFHFATVTIEGYLISDVRINVFLHL